MTIIIDIVIVALILICTILGYVRGLTKVLIKIIAFVLSIIIAFTFFIPVSKFVIQNTTIDDTLETSIRNIIVAEKTEEEEEKIPTAMSEYINKKIKETSDGVRQEVADSTARDLTETIVKAGSWIAIFIFARIALILLKLISSLITKLPVIKQFDKLGGVIYGLLQGFFITYLALAIISFVAPMTKGDLVENINKSHVGGMMYNNNLLINIIF